MEEQVREFLTGQFGDAVIKEESFRGDQQFSIRGDKLLDICEALHDDETLDVNMLKDITCVDWLGHPEAEHGRFEVVYNLYSFKHKYRFFLMVRLPEDNPHIHTLVDLWAGANWLEREVWDLFGVVFDGHPDLTKLLTPDELEGFPLRKDYPLTYEQPRFTWNKDDPPEVIK